MIAHCDSARLGMNPPLRHAVAMPHSYHMIPRIPSNVASTKLLIYVAIPFGESSIAHNHQKKGKCFRVIFFY